MFIGKYNYILDKKNRLFIPANFRQQNTSYILTGGIEQCLLLYPISIWEKLTDKLLSLPHSRQDTRKFLRIILSRAGEVKLDSQGRILIPLYLIEYACLKKELIILGIIDHLEIWDKEIWDKYEEENHLLIREISEKLEI